MKVLLLLQSWWLDDGLLGFAAAVRSSFPAAIVSAGTDDFFEFHRSPPFGFSWEKSDRGFFRVAGGCSTSIVDSGHGRDSFHGWFGGLLPADLTQPSLNIRPETR